MLALQLDEDQSRDVGQSFAHFIGHTANGLGCRRWAMVGVERSLLDFERRMGTLRSVHCSSLADG